MHYHESQNMMARASSTGAVQNDSFRHQIGPKPSTGLTEGPQKRWKSAVGFMMASFCLGGKRYRCESLSQSQRGRSKWRSRSMHFSPWTKWENHLRNLWYNTALVIRRFTGLLGFTCFLGSTCFLGFTGLSEMEFISFPIYWTSGTWNNLPCISHDLSASPQVKYENVLLLWSSDAKTV